MPPDDVDGLYLESRVPESSRQREVASFLKCFVHFVVLFDLYSLSLCCWRFGFRVSSFELALARLARARVRNSNGPGCQVRGISTGSRAVNQSANQFSHYRGAGFGFMEASLCLCLLPPAGGVAPTSGHHALLCYLAVESSCCCYLRSALACSRPSSSPCHARHSA